MYKILILGPQGSGKGTQAVRLSQKLNVPALSMGQLLRNEVASGSALAHKISSLIDAGQLVPDDVALEVLKKRLEQSDCAQGYILDGYPRNKAQYDIYKDFDIPTFVLVIDVPESVSMARMEHRAQVDQRDDDTPAVMRERLRVFREETAPIIDMYKEQGLAHVIDGVGSMEDVEGRIDAIVGANSDDVIASYGTY